MWRVAIWYNGRGAVVSCVVPIDEGLDVAPAGFSFMAGEDFVVAVGKAAVGEAIAPMMVIAAFLTTIGVIDWGEASSDVWVKHITIAERAWDTHLGVSVGVDNHVILLAIISVLINALTTGAIILASFQFALHPTGLTRGIFL